MGDVTDGGGRDGSGGGGSQTGMSTGTGVVSFETPLSPDAGGTIDGWFRFQGSGGTGSYPWMCEMDCVGTYGGPLLQWLDAGNNPSLNDSDSGHKSGLGGGNHLSTAPTLVDSFFDSAASHLSLTLSGSAALGVGLSGSINISADGLSLTGQFNVGLGLDVSGALTTSTFNTGDNGSAFGGTSFSVGDGFGVTGDFGFGSHGPYADFGPAYNAGFSIQSTVGATSGTISWKQVQLMMPLIFTLPH